MILNFAQERYYLENKVDIKKARKSVKFQSSRALKHYQSLGNFKIYYSHYIVEVMYHHRPFFKQFPSF